MAIPVLVGEYHPVHRPQVRRGDNVCGERRIGKGVQGIIDALEQRLYVVRVNEIVPRQVNRIVVRPRNIHRRFIVGQGAFDARNDDGVLVQIAAQAVVHSADVAGVVVIPGKPQRTRPVNPCVCAHDAGAPLDNVPEGDALICDKQFRNTIVVIRKPCQVLTERNIAQRADAPHQFSHGTREHEACVGYEIDGLTGAVPYDFTALRGPGMEQHAHILKPHHPVQRRDADGGHFPRLDVRGEVPAGNPCDGRIGLRPVGNADFHKQLRALEYDAVISPIGILQFHRQLRRNGRADFKHLPVTGIAVDLKTVLQNIVVRDADDCPILVCTCNSQHLGLLRLKQRLDSVCYRIHLFSPPYCSMMSNDTVHALMRTLYAGAAWSPE